MATLRIVCWNVLHRVHAENYHEPSIGIFPDESLRVSRVAARVRAWMDEGVDAVILQEVSGDVVKALRDSIAVVGESVGAVHVHTYPRVPSFKRPTTTMMTERSEHLVIVTANRDATVIAAETFPDDPGKGFLAVRAGGIIYASTHISYGALLIPQLTAITQYVRGACFDNGIAVVGGDFNAEAGVTASALGSDFVLADLRNEPVTRPSATGPGATIDHVIAFGAVCTGARVLDDESLSDHRPVATEFETNRKGHHEH